MSSADNLCKQFGPRLARQNVGLGHFCRARSGSKLLEKLILKNNSRQEKNMNNYPVDKKLKCKMNCSMYTDCIKMYGTVHQNERG